MKALSRIIILLLLSIHFTACTSTRLNLANDNDEDSDIGIGGTGLLAKQVNDDSGIGGTGILGKITGFGSIFVNGIEVEYDDKTPFSINGKTAKYQALQIGDIVEILTEDSAQHTQAVAINLRHEVIGVVTANNPATYSFMINEQKIIQPINSLPLPQVGKRVAVAGFRINEKTIISSRVTTALTTADLLRRVTDLPYRDKSSQWLVQLHVKERARFMLNDTAHIFNINKSDDTTEKPMNIKILKLTQSASKQLILNETISPENIPVGRPTFAPVDWKQQNKTPYQSPWGNTRQWQKKTTNPSLGTGNQQNRSNRKP